MENHIKLVGNNYRTLWFSKSELTLARPTHLFQQLQLWKALDFRRKFFLLTVANVLCVFSKPISGKDRKHMFANTF